MPIVVTISPGIAVCCQAVLLELTKGSLPQDRRFPADHRSAQTLALYCVSPGNREVDSTPHSVGLMVIQAVPGGSLFILNSIWANCRPSQAAN
jgi:hypothetical protein